MSITRIQQVTHIENLRCANQINALKTQVEQSFGLHKIVVVRIPKDCVNSILFPLFGNTDILKKKQYKDSYEQVSQECRKRLKMAVFDHTSKQATLTEYQQGKFVRHINDFIGTLGTHEELVMKAKQTWDLAAPRLLSPKYKYVYFRLPNYEVQNVHQPNKNVFVAEFNENPQTSVLFVVQTKKSFEKKELDQILDDVLENIGLTQEKVKQVKQETQEKKQKVLLEEKPQKKSIILEESSLNEPKIEQRPIPVAKQEKSHEPIKKSLPSSQPQPSSKSKPLNQQSQPTNPPIKPPPKQPNPQFDRIIFCFYLLMFSVIIFELINSHQFSSHRDPTKINDSHLEYKLSANEIEAIQTKKELQTLLWPVVKPIGEFYEAYLQQYVRDACEIVRGWKGHPSLVTVRKSVVDWLVWGKLGLQGLANKLYGLLVARMRLDQSEL